MMILTLIAVLLINGMFVGCSGTEDPMRPADSGKTAENRTGVSLAMLKTADQAPGAPQAPGVGVPSVKEVGFYHDWKLTQDVQESVSVGDTIFVKVVFSEPMKHVVSDEKNARPILYHRRTGKEEQLVRFKMAAHGARGENFIAGDAKPLQSGTDDYICKYTVVPEDEGRGVAILIGKASVDVEGNPLAAFYRHPVKLQVKPTAVAPMEPEQGIDPTPAPTAPESTDTPPLMITAITYYREGGGDDPISAGESVDAGTTIITVIVFSMPVRPDSVLISYPKGHGTEHFYHSTGVFRRGSYVVTRDGTIVSAKLIASEEIFSLLIERAASLDGNVLKRPVATPEIPVMGVVQPEEPSVDSPVTIIQQPPRPVPGADDFVGAVYIPNGKQKEDVLRSRALPVPGATVIIVSGSRAGERVTTDQDGRYVFPGVAEDSLHLRVEKRDLEPKEVIVHRAEATTLADGTSLLKYIKDPQHQAGNILVGHRIPSAARPILERISVVDDLLYVDIGSYRWLGATGRYMNGVAVVTTEGNYGLRTIAHEFFHAHQHALTFVDGWFDRDAWLRTPEGVAYVQARKRDVREFGMFSVDRHYGEADAGAVAAVFALYWIAPGDLKQEAPNRYKWVDEWFGR